MNVSASKKSNDRNKVDARAILSRCNNALGAIKDGKGACAADEVLEIARLANRIHFRRVKK